MALANAVVRNGGSKFVAFFVTLPLFFFFIIVAFFKYSELRLHEFIAKMIRTHFLDTTKKYQLNRNKPDPVAISFVMARKTEHDTIIEQKDLILDQDKL